MDNFTHIGIDLDQSLSQWEAIEVLNEKQQIKCINSSDLQKREGSLYCDPAWDKISCWPVTLAGHIAVIPCFTELFGVPYDSSQNASRLCLPNGTWAEKSDYSKCNVLVTALVADQVPTETDTIKLIHFSGYAVSLVALAFALAIFFFFKDLHCTRNTIHANFMTSHLFFGISWIILGCIQSKESVQKIFGLPCLLSIILSYFNLTTFFWMFVEGLYLYILVVKTFSMNRVKIFTYIFIGWGVPIILMALWIPLKYYFPDEILIGLNFISAQNPLRGNCPWWSYESLVDHICLVLPMILILLVNIFFLGMIIYVLATKLGTSTSAEFQQYRKTAKALLVLTPLLGLTYILLLVTPESGPGQVVVLFLHAFLFSTQGLSVAVLYCFLNAEVRNSLRYYIERWKVDRILRTGRYPILMPHRKKSRPQRDRYRSYRYRFSKNGNSCIITTEKDRGSRERPFIQKTLTSYPTISRYSSRSTKSASLSEAFL